MMNFTYYVEKTEMFNPFNESQVLITQDCIIFCQDFINKQSCFDNYLILQIMFIILIYILYFYSKDIGVGGKI
jgi:hypothetical protein